MDDFIRTAIVRGERLGIDALDPLERLVYLLSELEVLTDMEGIDSFVDAYGRAGLAEVGAFLRACGADALGGALISEDLDEANDLVTARSGYDEDAIRAEVTRRRSSPSLGRRGGGPVPPDHG